MREYWRDVPGYEGFYLISNVGRVQSLLRKVEIKRKGLLSHVENRPGKMLKQNDSDAHCWITLTDGVKKKKHYVHRLVLLAFVGPPPFANAVSRHKNGIANDNRPSNLVWGSQKENCIDMALHGTQHRQKMSAMQVVNIRKRAAAGVRGCRKLLAKEFGVDPTTISDIVRRKSWKHI